MAYITQLYKSTDLNAPPIKGEKNSLITFLNATLVDGWGFSGVTITGITKVGTTATATVSAADCLRLQTGMIITISGCTGGDATYYNGTFSITVPTTAGATTFTYTMTGTPGGSATGTPVMSSWLPITSITQTAGTATVTTQHNHLLTTGQYIDVAGANESGYNLTNAMVTVTGPATFTYAVNSGTSSPATGSPTWARADLQWARPFSAGTNSQSYRSADTNSNRLYVQIIDNGGLGAGDREAQIYGAEVLTADQTPDNGGGLNSGRFPTVATYANGLCLRKSTTADGVCRAYDFWGDSKTFYFVIQTGDSNNGGRHCYGFGHYNPTKSNHAFNTFVAGGNTFNATTGVIASGGCALSDAKILSSSTSATSTACYGARSYSQVGSAVVLQPSIAMAGSVAPNVIGDVTSTRCCVLPVPNGPDGAVYIQPILFLEYVSLVFHIAGRPPGMYTHMHNAFPCSHHDLVTGVVGLSGITLTGISTYAGNSGSAGTAGLLLVDTFGPW